MASEWELQSGDNPGEQTTTTKLNNNDKCRAYKSGGQSLNSLSYDKIELEVETYDPNSIFNTGTYRCIPTTEGYYLVNACLSFINVIVDAKYWVAMIYKNGAVVAAKQSSTTNASGYTATQGVVSTIVYMNGTTDYLELYGVHNFGGAGAVNNDSNFTYMSIHRLSYSS